MTVIGFLVIIVVVAVGCVLLGMAISHSNSRRSQSRESSPPSHRPNTRPGSALHAELSSGWGWVVGVLLGIPLLLGLALVTSWVAYSEAAWESPSHSAVSSHTGEKSADLPPLQIKTDFWIGGLLSLAVLIGAGIWIAHRRQHWSFSGAVHSTVGSLWVLPLLVSVGWVGYLIWPHLSLEPLVRDTDYNPSQTEFHRFVDLEKGEIDTQAGFYLPQTTTGMPSWVTEGITTQGGVLHVPVHSGWKHSEAAADNEAKAQAMRVIREDFVHSYPDAEQWRIDATLQVVHANVAEVEESKVFPFREEPMYRTHLLVEVSDNVRGEMFKHWCPDLQKIRMTMLATFGGLLTLVCFAGGACLSLDMRTGGNYRRWLRTATVLVVVAGAAAAHGVLGSLWFQHSV